MTFVFMSVFSRASSSFLGLGLTALLLSGGRAHADERTGPATASAPAAGARPASSRQVRLDTIVRQGDTFSARLEGGAQAELTLDLRLQDTAEEVFQTFQLPYAGAVVLSLPDGRVLALAGRSTVSPALGAEELALHPWAPAASVFEVVSASAMLADGGVSADSRTCYPGGVSSIVLDYLVDIPRIDRTCATLAYGLGMSQDAIIAKFASRRLGPEKLERMAHAIGFGV